ncbi:MAG: Rne/Rng family ribonuclease [Pseudomonadota bacterium]
MGKKMLIDATHPEETRVVVVDGNKVDDFDFESINKRQLAGNIYLAKVTRVEPSLQAAFVDYGGNRHGFLAFSEIHPDYYQIPVADRKALLEEEERAAREESADENGNGDEAPKKAKRARRSRGGKKPAAAAEAASDVSGLEVITAEDAPATDGSETPDSLTVMDVAEAPAEGDAPGPSESDPDPETRAEADDASEAPEPPGEAGTDTPPDEPKTMAEDAGLEEDKVSEELEGDGASRGASRSDSPEKSAEDETSDASDGEADDAKSDADDPADASDGAKQKKDKSDEKPKKRARRTRKRRSDKDDGENSDTDAEEEDIESVGAEDLQEEVAASRARRRRNYKIQDVVKVRQIMLVQVVKEERGNKGAALTTYLSLAGRYCVLMPNTARGGGISRKITQVGDRKRLREIVDELDVPKGMGLIVRTAGAERTRAEIKRDYEFLCRQWEQVRDLTMKSIAPCLIYEEGSLIKRSIRDLYSKEIDSISVEGENGYREAKDYMKMLMPSHAKNVQQYTDQIPLFIRYQVESTLNGMFSPTVQLKSGGYIVIGVTEALVAVDVNSGRATKQGSIEETALQTNLEAADEVARQCRLRDLAGLIVIDFIDMEENRNNRAVEKRMKERLKTDRARIQIGRISSFGLMEMSRQRLRPGMLEVTTSPCPQCQGTGVIRSDENMALSILREVEEEGVRGRSAEIQVAAPIDVANFLLNHKRAHISQIEARYGVSILIVADPSLTSPDFRIERSKQATRAIEKAPAAVTADSVVTSDEIEEEDDTETTPDDDSGEKREGRSRRRRGRRGGRKRRSVETGDDNGSSEADSDGSSEGSSDTDEEDKPKRSRRRRGKRGKDDASADEEEIKAAEEASGSEVPEQAAETSDDAAVPEPVAEAPAVQETEEPPAEVVELKTEEAESPEPTASEDAPTPGEEDKDRPKRRGWWSFGG